MPITEEGTARGHGYNPRRMNAPCQKCSDDQGVLVLTCDYDDGDEE